MQSKFLRVHPHLSSWGNHLEAAKTGLKHIFLVRHAESVYNARCQKFTTDSVYGEIARREFHHDPDLIDSPLTQKGMQIALSTRNESLSRYDPSDTIIFVSPLLRALETAQSFITANKLQRSKVIVLPQLSEVLSKICDLSSDIMPKYYRFSKFDFNFYGKWMQIDHPIEQDAFRHCWQDSFVENSLKKHINEKETFGRRYLELLEHVFPVSIETPIHCYQRSLEGLKIAKQICSELECQNAVLIAHNRVLRNIQTSHTFQQAEHLKNLEVRQLTL